MNWQEVVAHPGLQNLPCKIELNASGQLLISSPTKVAQSAWQGELAYYLQLLGANGRVLAGCAVATPQGTKVADVAWASRARFAQIRRETECSIAPEICVEVFSASNTREEMDEKRALYLARGAQEFWTCDDAGNINFSDESGPLAQSVMFPEFPQQILLED